MCEILITKPPIPVRAGVLCVAFPNAFSAQPFVSTEPLITSTVGNTFPSW
jgi:hypothetical protein